MRGTTLGPTLLCTVLIAGLTAIPTASAEGVKWKEGSWRLELAGYGGLNTKHNQRSDDFGIVGTIEREWPAWQRATLGLRFHPLFYYGQEQDDPLFRRFPFRDNNNFNPDYDDDDVWGIGLGPALRVYQRPETRDGLFLELGISLLLHTNEFIDNSSDINFVTEIGLGYKFSNAWHVAGKLRHISNAGFGGDNSATNGWGLGIGYSF